MATQESKRLGNRGRCSTDRTKQFFAQLNRVRSAGPAALALPSALAGKTVLVTSGFLGSKKHNYFVDAVERVRRLGLNAEHIASNDFAATEANVELIQSHIRALAPGQGILVGHSRGGVMNLDAYRRLEPADRAKIAKIIILQSPYYGTPLADALVATGLQRAILGTLSRIMYGGENVVTTIGELTLSGREAAEKSLPPLVAEDLAKIYTMRSIIGRKDAVNYLLGDVVIKRSGNRSDGISPYELSEICGTSDITIEDYNHEHFVVQRPNLAKRLSFYRPHKSIEAGDAMEALLHLIYEPASTNSKASCECSHNSR